MTNGSCSYSKVVSLKYWRKLAGLQNFCISASFLLKSPKITQRVLAFLYIFFKGKYWSRRVAPQNCHSKIADLWDLNSNTQWNLWGLGKITKMNLWGLEFYITHTSPKNHYLCPYWLQISNFYRGKNKQEEGQVSLSYICLSREKHQIFKLQVGLRRFSWKNVA